MSVIIKKSNSHEHSKMVYVFLLIHVLVLASSKCCILEGINFEIDHIRQLI